MLLFTNNAPSNNWVSENGAVHCVTQGQRDLTQSPWFILGLALYIGAKGRNMHTAEIRRQKLNESMQSAYEQDIAAETHAPVFS